MLCLIYLKKVGSWKKNESKLNKAVNYNFRHVILKVMQLLETSGDVIQKSYLPILQKWIFLLVFTVRCSGRILWTLFYVSLRRGDLLRIRTKRSDYIILENKCLKYTYCCVCFSVWKSIMSFWGNKKKMRLDLTNF